MVAQGWKSSTATPASTDESFGYVHSNGHSKAKSQGNHEILSAAENIFGVKLIRRSECNPQNVDDRKLQSIPAEGASFDSYAKNITHMLANTREELLREIDCWIDDPKSKTIFWLNGKAGTGKSTISRTVARSRSRQGDLGASFFFKRGEVDRGNLSKFVSTVARRLPGARRRLRPIADKAVREQFEKLVREPLSKATLTSLCQPSVVIVVDALDECERDADITLILQLFSNLRFAGLLLVRVLVTSRPELPGCSRRAETTVDWPGEANIGSSPGRSALFIFAATLCRFINDDISEALMSFCRACSSCSQQVLIVRSERLDIIESFRLIVGTIVTLANPLSMRALRYFSMFTAIAPFIVPRLSCRPGKRELAEFRVEERHTHQSLAKHCLRIMRGALQKNICGLSFPGMRRSSVDSGQLEKRMPSQLQYACMHWVYHQTSGKPELSDDKNVHGFLMTHFLHWLEAMSLLGRVKECLDALRLLARWLQTREDSSLLTFVADAERFVQAYFSVVAETPLQIYCCLAFAPRKSVVEENWDACLLTLEGHSSYVNSVVFSHDSKKVASGSDDETIRIWNAETGKCERELKGHSSYVNSVVFSHDSKKVASGSFDQTIRIWNAETGECERKLKGHSSYVNSVASGSFDQMIQIWNAETGECERKLKGHSSRVNSVVFSHDSKKVASGSDDETIRIWNAETGKCERELKGHSSWVRSVVFSHDSKKVASGSDDKTIRIWNAETGECERKLKGHSSWVNSVVFSHDSKKVASGSYDKTIRIWNAETGKCEETVLLVGYAHVLSFATDRRGIITNRGVFVLSGDSQTYAEPAMLQQSLEVPVLTCTDGTWITVAKTILLWLPPECRNGEVAVSGSTVAIGCQSGRVLVLGISMAEVERWMDAGI
ncbi:Vegetative incompatibility protein HET-E-1 [Fusarium culmorum]|uniref:Vegetative incompatibility protein HET-E-1 n=1 Tax=Fusarium culmorum TaxID=5516 RepID=A0A2T4GCF8_FUSCU|nr:Vegetative incompatibility protein HET-E-1 [Fusarium culmorum]